MPASSQTQEPALLTRARAQGQVDVFRGKRRWIRYSLGMVVEVTTDPTVKAASWRATTHNISGGGMGIWSTRPLSVFSPIYVRDCGEGDRPVWLAGRITHSTLGLRGYLLGIAFDEPTPPDADLADKSDADDEDRGSEHDGGRSAAGRQSLRTKCAVRGALACGTAMIAAFALFSFLAQVVGPNQAAAAALAGGLLVGALIGWLSVGPELGYLRALQVALRELASAQPPASGQMEAPCTELAALERAFQDLDACWRKREHVERSQREKLEEVTRIKTNILSIVSHDLRTPLTSILLYAQMLKEELDTLADEDKQQFIEIVCAECTRLSRLVDDLLEVQRLESGRGNFHLKPCDLGETIRACGRVFEPLAQRRSMTLTFDCPESIPPVPADPDKIAQVLNNLISNALKYTPAGGKVAVSAEGRGTEVLICVADNGPGIPRNKWDQIFDRFTQLSDPDVSQIAGFGLGLYIVRRIVEAHGGKTWVDSEVGKGSAFYIALPTEPGNTNPLPEQAPATPTCRVLACDSDPELVATIGQALRAENCDVRSAHSGRRMLQQLDHGDIDVLVTDVMLPDMDVGELLDALNGLPNRSFRTIIHSYDGDGQAFKRRGADIFLKRPVSSDELVQAVRVAMQKQSTAGLTIVLVESPYLDAGRLSRCLLEAGHMTMAADGLKEAAGLARDYAGDILVVASHSLSPGWDDLQEVDAATGDQTVVMVLCDALRKRERQLEEEHGVWTVAYRPGEEEGVVDAIMEFEGELARSQTHEANHRL